MSREPPPLVPREVLFANPDKVQPRISPDGTRLAYIGPHDGVLNVWVGELGAASDDFRAVTDDTDRGIRNYSWSHDNRRILYLQDEGGDENWRLYDVDLDSAYSGARGAEQGQPVPAREHTALLGAHRRSAPPLLFGDEGHSLAKPENRLRSIAATERFLAKHLGGREEQ